jgi:hypothetical protein
LHRFSRSPESSDIIIIVNVEQVRAVICDGPSCGRNNAPLREELPDKMAHAGFVCEVGPRGQCHEVCELNKSHVIAKRGYQPLVALKGAAKKLDNGSIAIYPDEVVEAIRILNTPKPISQSPKVA